MKKLLITIVAFLLLLIIAGCLTFYLRPLAVLAYFSRRSLTSAGFAERITNTPAGPQTSFQAGNGPTLVFLHGAGDNAGTWAKVAPQFTTRYRVVLLDLPGHHASAPASGPLKMQTVVETTDAVLATSPPPLVIVGNSLGSWLAMLYAQHHPDRVARIILVDGGAVRGHRLDLAFVPATREQSRQMWEAVVDPGTPRVPDFILDDVTRTMKRGPVARLVAGGDMEKYLMPDAELTSYSVPVDLLWGESDRLVPLDYARHLASGLPAVRLATLPRCGHVPQNECPRAFGSALQKILAEAPPQAAVAAPIHNAAKKEKQ